MTKRTPLQEHRVALKRLHAAQQKAREEFESKKLDAIERVLNDREKIKRIETDPNLSPEERLALCKSLQALPRIVLGLYKAELEKARRSPDPGKPSDIAYEQIGRVLGLGPDRIKALCNEGRRHLQEGMPAAMAVNMTAAEFEQQKLRRRKRKTA